MIFRSAISGIMVDGIGNLSCVFNDSTPEEGEKILDQQKFLNADLIVLGTKVTKEFQEVNKDAKFPAGTTFSSSDKYCFYYPMWAVYGSAVVESRIHRGNIKELKGVVKTVWANRKPYILNGD